MIGIVGIMQQLAIRGHAGQYRRGPGHVPYIEHPKAVAELLSEWGADDITLAVAWGHDLFEDTDVSADDIRKVIPDKMAAEAIVSDIKMLTSPNGRTTVAHLAKIAENGSDRAILVKCADRICNTKDFLKAGRVSKAKVYLSDAKPVFDAAGLDAPREEYRLLMDTIETTP